MHPKTLLERLYCLDHLHFAWKNLNKGNPDSFGLSGESISDFEANLETNLQSLSSRLKVSDFQFSPTRPFLIPKDNNKFRPLQIPEVEDRVVLKGIALILEDLLHKLLLPSEGISYAYQKGKGVQDALFRVKEHYDNGNRIIYEADIIDFFGTVSRLNIIDLVCEHLPDLSLNDLIRNGITPQVGNLDSIPAEYRYLFADKGGIPQGNPLSPLFSNLYLSPFDAVMKEAGFNSVRYADDFVVLAPSVDAARQAYEMSRRYLSEKLGVAVHELSEDLHSKTRIVDPTKETFSFLSVSFDGHHLFPSQKNKQKFLKDLLSLCSEKKNPNVLKLLTKIKNKHDGWISTFLFTDVQRYFEEIDWIINWGIYKYLTACNWPLQQNSLEKMPAKYRRQGDLFYQSGICLSMEQRRNSGILLSSEIYSMRTEGKKKVGKTTLTRALHSSQKIVAI